MQCFDVPGRGAMSILGSFAIHSFLRRHTKSKVNFIPNDIDIYLTDPDPTTPGEVLAEPGYQTILRKLICFIDSVENCTGCVLKLKPVSVLMAKIPGIQEPQMVSSGTLRYIRKWLDSPKEVNIRGEVVVNDGDAGWYFFPYGMCNGLNFAVFDLELPPVLSQSIGLKRISFIAASCWLLKGIKHDIDEIERHERHGALPYQSMHDIMESFDLDITKVGMTIAPSVPPASDCLSSWVWKALKRQAIYEIKVVHPKTPSRIMKYIHRGFTFRGLGASSSEELKEWLISRCRRCWRETICVDDVCIHV